MKRLQDNQCRRCGTLHEEGWQITDTEGCWAMVMAECECGHRWTVIHTAPANLSRVKAWLARGCEPADGPAGVAPRAGWHAYRLEGIAPSQFSRAS